MLKGWEQTTFITSHFSSKVAFDKWSLSKKRTLLKFWLFRLSAGVMNEEATKMICKNIIKRLNIMKSHIMKSKYDEPENHLLYCSICQQKLPQMLNPHYQWLFSQFCWLLLTAKIIQLFYLITLGSRSPTRSL